jgi:hypothetical protein
MGLQPRTKMSRRIPCGLIKGSVLLFVGPATAVDKAMIKRMADNQSRLKLSGSGRH